MESANLKLPEHEVIGSNLGDPSNCFPFGIGSHVSSSSSSSSSPPFSSCSTGSVGNSNNNNPSASRHYKMCDDNNNIDHDHHESSNNNVMIHSLGSSWNPNNLSSSYHMQLAKIKDEISESFPKFTELLLNSPSSANIDNYTHFLLKNASDEKDSAQIDGPDFGGHFSSTGFTTTSQIYPSVNISSLNNFHQSQSYSSVMMSQLGLSDNGASLGAFSFNGNFGAVDDQIQRPHDRLSCDRETDQRSSSLRSEMEDLEKRSMRRSNQSTTAPNKKSRSESKSPSCPPFKVRKEKLGDRIAALQQLVSPFGKTDTASVLMEAIGYIKFLQNQVENLSVPYMKPSRHKSINKTIQGLYQGLNKDDGIEEAKRDLRSRGLCLVPLSCMSYVTGDNGGAAAATIWPPPNFFGM